MTAPDLKPCPFCGGAASIHKGMQAFDDFEVHCDPCGICGPNFGSMGETLTPKEDAIAAWNTRTDLAVVEIDLRSVMMEQIEEAAGQSPWVPPVYMMNEIISDCCAFLREPRAPDPAAIREAALREAASMFDEGSNIAQTILALIAKGAAE